MATAHPGARIAFAPAPVAAFVPEALAATFASEPLAVEFAPAPALAFDFAAFKYLAGADNYNFVTADGEVLSAGGESLTW